MAAACCAREIISSTGPPGNSWMRIKHTSEIPMSVGTMSSKRRRIYERIYLIFPERSTSIMLKGLAVPAAICSARKFTASTVPSA